MLRIAHTPLLIVWLFGLCLGPVSWGQEKTITFSDHLQMMVDLDKLYEPPQPLERCIQFSSYDRHCEKSIGIQEAKPWDPKGWYANIDRDWYLREEVRDQKTEYVLCDVNGPGAIVRIWSANPTGTLFFYVDGAKEPTWSVDFKGLLSGEIPPIEEPMAGIRGRGYNYHLPIPFAKHMKVNCSLNDHHYHVNVKLYPPQTKVESFDPNVLETHKDLIKKTGAMLEAGPSLEGLQEEKYSGQMSMSGDPNDPSDWTCADIELEGPRVIREITLKITPLEKSDLDLPNILRRILFCIDLQDRRTVRVPVADFFASVPGFNPYRSYPMGVTKEGVGYCRFPIPLKDGGNIRLVADGPLPKVQYDITIRSEETEIPQDALVFRASWSIKKKVRTRPFSDFRVLNAQGPGRFVGCCLSVANPTIYWWGEGDEKFYVDGETFPSTFGTGTEDYFGYAWADPSFFNSPYHSQPQCDGPDNKGYTCLSRFQIHDMVPFQTSILFDLEIWNWKDVYMDYATCAYWYGRPEASHGLAFVPAYDKRTVDKIWSDGIFRAKNALEAEDLTDVSVTGGKTETGFMGWYSDRKWSHEKHLFWKEAKPGDKLSFDIPVEKKGRYQFEAVFTKARDYAIVQVLVNDKEVGDPVDLYAPYVVTPTFRLSLGEVSLDKGTNKIEIQIMGKNPKAVSGYLVGLDYIRINRL